MKQKAPSKFLSYSQSPGVYIINDLSTYSVSFYNVLIFGAIVL